MSQREDDSLGPAIAVNLDLSCTQDPHNSERGIATWAAEFAIALDALATDVDPLWVLADDGPVPAKAERLLAGGRLERMSGTGERRPPDIRHLLSPFYEYLDDVGWARGPIGPLVVTVYDLIKDIYPDVYLPDAGSRARYAAQVERVRQADLILCISEATRADVIERLGVPEHKVVAVGTGVSPRFRPASSPSDALFAARSDVHGLRPGFLMYTGGIDYRKNIEGLLRGYAALPSTTRADHQLVIVCRIGATDRARLGALCDDLGVTEDVLFAGYVSDDVMLRLYQCTSLFVFPSIYEGFGIPVAEAMACGAVCIAGDNSSLREVLPLAEARFDANKDSEITAAIIRGLGDEDLRDRLRDLAARSDFSWRSVVERTADAYRQLMRRPKPVTVRRTRPRVALLSPMPPASSGIADYSARLLPRMLDRVDVDVFTDATADRTPAPGLSWFHYRAFRAAEAIGGGYDDVVYCIGNSTFHVWPMRILQQRRSGTAIAHDVNLQGLVDAAVLSDLFEADAIDREVVAARIARRPPARLAGHTIADIDDYFASNDPLSRTVLAHVDRFLVHSRTAASIARLEHGVSPGAHIEVIPFGHRSPPVRRGAARQRDVVASFGIASDVKQSGKVLDAFLELGARHPHLTFAIVGEIHWPAERVDEARRRIAVARREANVLLTGRVTPAEYDSWLARARVAVQLRESSRGETSAAIADCFSFSVPVIASDVGSVRELPGQSLVLVSRDVSATQLADEVHALLADNSRTTAIKTAMRDHVRQCTFAAAAAAVIEHLF